MQPKIQIFIKLPKKNELIKSEDKSSFIVGNQQLYTSLLDAIFNLEQTVSCGKKIRQL